MSKSLGNTILPQEVSSKFGAEILRLWSPARIIPASLRCRRRSSTVG